MHKSSHIKCLPLIQYQIGYGYRLSSESIQYLQNLPEDDNYTILSITGRQKTGKSYLGNKLINDQYMFPIRYKVNNCNQGIMISTKLLSINDMKIIVLDCQGFGSLESTQDRDCKLFVLCLLLSSVIIYNSMGTIDQQTLNNFSMIIQVGKMFQKQLETQNSMPALFWVLRDFSLQMEDKNGAPMTAKQYLQYALEQQKGNSRIICHKNRIRRVIKQLFMERTCDTLVLPQQDLPSQGSVQGNLRNQFVQDFNRFSNKLFHLIYKKGCKQFNKNRLTISSFLSILKIYIKNINKSLAQGSILKIQHMVHQVKQYQLMDYKNKFNLFLIQSKNNISHQIGIIAKDNQGMEEDVQGIKRKYMEGIQRFYQAIKSGMGGLASEGDYSELAELKSSFYQQLQRQCSQFLKSYQFSSTCQQQIDSICEYISHISDENRLEHEYAIGMRELKDKNIGKRKGIFINMMMRVQITYLRRKVQLTKQMKLKYDKLCMEYQFAKQELNKAQQKNTEIQNQLIEQIKQSRKVLLTPPKQQVTKQIGVKQMVKQQTLIKKSNSQKCCQNENNHYLSSKGQNSSFYSPYVMIQKSEYIIAKIIRTLIKQDSKRNNYIQYVIDVNLLGQKWIVNRKYKDFSQLHSILVMMFQNLSLPDCRAINGPLNATDFNISKKQVIQQRRKQLQLYLKQLMISDVVRNSRILQKFLKINKQYTIL